MCPAHAISHQQGRHLIISIYITTTTTTSTTTTSTTTTTTTNCEQYELFKFVYNF
jgi:hypothetical protein